MPVEYSGILAEHMAVRTRAGLFDVSHMGEIEIVGPQALDLVQWVTCNDASKLAVGQAQYSGLMNDRGTFVDDILVHKVSDTHYFLCVNAGGQDVDFAYIVSQNAAHKGLQNRFRARWKIPARAIRNSRSRGRAPRKFFSFSPRRR